MSATHCGQKTKGGRQLMWGGHVPGRAKVACRRQGATNETMRISPSRADASSRKTFATAPSHCTFALNGTFALMGETDPVELALARVRESLAAADQVAATLTR
jgi:hypothetical protein